MFRKNLTVVYKPMKNNSVLLPDSYFRTIQSYENGCICMSYQHDRREHYMSWAPYGSNMKDTEIGINSNVAKAIGLKEGAIITCSVIADVAVLDSISVTANTQKDWEMLEVSSYRIKTTLLDQTRVVTNGQSLVIWINAAMFLIVNVDRLRPNAPYGKLANFTEVHVAPYKQTSPKYDREEIIERTKPLRPMSVHSPPEADRVKPARPLSVHSNGATNGYHQNGNETLLPVASKSPAKFRNLDHLAVDLQKNDPKQFEFRVLSSKWEDSQMCDLYLTRHNLPASMDTNQVFQLLTAENREFFVSIKVLGDQESFPHNLYPSIEMNDILMHRLGLAALERVTLRPKVTPLNVIDRIELAPSKAVDLSRAKDIEHYFKQYVLDTAAMYPVLINQSQVFKLKVDTIVTVTFFPDTLRHCCIDAKILRDCPVKCRDEVMELVKPNGIVAAVKVPNGIQPSPSFMNLTGNVSGHEYVQLSKFGTIVDDCVERMVVNLCLDERNAFRKMGNLIIVGKQKSGKSTVCKRIIDRLSESPFHCHSEVFNCSKNKGRKPDSILKDLRQILNTCINLAPSILILDNLDILAQSIAEQTPDGEYYNRVSDVLQHLILEYTRDNPIAIIATVTNKSNLNKRIFTSRGRHLFHHVVAIPDLDMSDREKIICDLCQKLKTASISYKKFANLTEGYSVGDLVELVQRAIFYAYRTDSKKPVLSNDSLGESLKITNAYCLQGIEHNSKEAGGGENGDSDETDSEDEEGTASNRDPCDKSRKLAGLESVVTVLEEVLIWPAKYPTIFERSPLRNQAGVLLFGAPGTGKTFLVGKLAKLWHLRLISVKGPELLAKYIGQSEENVRNLFNRAKSARPCVLFFDEFDSLAPKRGHDSTGVTDRVVNQLLTELDGVEGLQGVIVIAATSRPELLDGALLRSGRIDRLVECPLPDRAARLAIFQTLSKTLNFGNDVDLAYFADKTDYYTGADIQSILTSANMTAVKECLDLDSENVPDKIVITQDHLMDAFVNTRPSLTGQDIAKYKHVYARFTNKEKPSRDFVAKRATLA